MSTTEIRSDSTDNYIVLSQYNTSDQDTEVAIVQALVQSAYQKTTIPTDASTYISPANDSSWDTEPLNPNYINTSAISNYPSGTLTEYSVLSNILINVDVSFNSYDTNISSVECANNGYAFSNLDTSAPYYDANYVVTQSLVDTCYDNVSSESVSGTFDMENANIAIQYAMQSRWNTTLGPYDGLNTVGQDPTALQQANDFNLNASFAQYGSDEGYTSYWWSVDTDTGGLMANYIDASYQPVTNHLLVENRDMSGVTLNIDNDVGIFRIQKAANTATTQVMVNDTSYIDISNTDLDYMPLFNGNPSVPLVPSSNKVDLPVPGAMTNAQFDTLFDTDVLNTIADGWTFTINVNETNGGYDISGNHPLMSNLDNSNILDNPYYMANYVSNTHNISFSNATIRVDASTNGQSQDASSISIDLSNGEVLTNTYAGVNGQIIINTNTIDTRCANVTSSAINNAYTQVIYDYDANAGVGYPDPLSNAEMTAATFNGMWQKVAQNSATNTSQGIESSNGAIMTLYANQIVNDNYDTNDFSFNFNNGSFEGSNDIQLWGVICSNSIVAGALYANPNYTNPQTSFSTSGNVNGLTDDLSYNEYRVVLTAKVKDDLNLQTAVNDVNGWELNYSGEGDSWLTTSSDNAFNQNSIPYYNLINPELGATIGYSYTYGTVQDSTGIGGLVDYVDVSYTYLNENNSFQIPQSLIVRNYDASYNTEYGTVPDSSYNFSGGIYNKNGWELVHITVHRTYNATFPASYGPYNNINLTVFNIGQTDQYYAIRNKNSHSLAPHSALKFVSASGLPNLQNVIESIAPAEGNSLSISGTMTVNDIKPFTSVTQGSYDSVNWITMSETISTDVYYGIDNFALITNPSGSMTTNIEFANSASPDGLTGQYYYMPFQYGAENNTYIIQNFTASDTTMTDNTNLGAVSFMDNLDYLTLTNGYGNVTSWNETNYTMTVIPVGNNIVFTVKDLSNNTVFSFSFLHNTVFLGTIFVTYIPQDYYRVENLLDTSFTEGFVTTDYGYNVANLSPVLQGLYIANRPETAPLSNLYCPDLGGYESFRVIGDYMSINEVGTTSPPTSAKELGTGYNGGSLTFQYRNGEMYYSAAFIFPKYRGYFSYTGSAINQYYTINRDSTIVTFNVAGEIPISQILTTNMYFNQGFNVNNLIDGSGNAVANLNLTGNFYYSIPPTEFDLTYIVNVTGDDVTVNIVNPNYQGDASNVDVPIGATPVVNPTLYSASMTLKDYGQNNMYTFSGLWYLTNALMAIRPSRVKLYNANYEATSLSYRIAYEVSGTNVYKALTSNIYDFSFNWLGNPALKGEQNSTVPPNSNDWVFYSSYDASAMYTGFSIGKKTIRLNENYAPVNSITYIVSTPPYYQFEQISINDCPIIPYDYDSSYNSNKITMYMPYISVPDGNLMDTFYPFTSEAEYTDINGNIYTVYTDQYLLNNIRFSLNYTPSITDAVENPDTNRYGLIVPGTYISVSLYLGQYDSENAGSHSNPIWEGTITSIPSVPDISSNGLLFRQRNDDGSIFFSALQFPADIGYPTGLQGYTEIFGSNPIYYYNIDFNIGNPSWYNFNEPITYFDVFASGVRPTLYTVVDINNPLNQINKRRVYKYTTNTTLHVDPNGNSTGLQTFNVMFNLGRSYYDFDISMNNTFPSNSSAIWQYPELVNNTVIDNASISWITDVSYDEITYVSWAFGNSVTSGQMISDLFSVGYNQRKWVYIQLEPFMRYMNQFRVQVGSIAWDGSVTAPLVNTRIVRISPQIQQPLLANNTYTIQEYSESTI